MAYLRSLNWALEIRYFPHPHDVHSLRYEVFFRYKGEPIIQNELLKFSPKIWEDRTPGAFLAHENDGCSLVPTLAAVLKSNQPAIWRPSDPDMTIAFYPGQVFPYLELEPEASMEKILSKDAPFTVITVIDGYNFGNEFAHHGFGPALVMIVKRPVLQEFFDALRAELDAFIEEYGPMGFSPEIKPDL